MITSRSSSQAACRVGIEDAPAPVVDEAHLAAISCGSAPTSSATTPSTASTTRTSTRQSSIGCAPRGCVQPGVLPEPGVSTEPRQLSDRSVPQHNSRQSQCQRPVPGQRVGAADHAAPGRPRLRLRAGRQAAHRLVLDGGGAARGRRLPGVRLQPVGHAVRRPRQRVHRLAEPHRPPGRGDRHRRDGRRAQSRRPLPPRHTARTASDRLVCGPRHRVHRAGARRPVADERQHLRPARAVRRSPLLSTPLPGQGPAGRHLRRPRRPDPRNGCAERISSNTPGRRETSSGARRRPTTA